MMWLMMLLMYPVLPIIVGLLLNEAKPKKNIVVGVTLPFEARQSEAVRTILASYRRNMWIAFGMTSAAILPALLFHHTSIAFSWLMLWVLLAIAAPYIVYVKAHSSLKKCKKASGWSGEGAGKTLVETNAAVGRPRRLRPWWFLPPVLLSLVPLAALLRQPRDAAFGVMLALYLSNALLTAGCYVAYRYLYRNRAEVVDAAAAVTQTLTRVRRYHWSRFWLGMAYVSGLFAIAAWLFFDSVLGLLLSTCVYTAALLILMLCTELAARRVQSTLTQGSGQGIYVDDDAFWLLGTIYFNPNDRHTLVNNRIGIGSTVNWARPAGKAMIVFGALCLLLIPAMCGWMIAEEFTPIRITCTESAIVADHLANVYTVPLDTVAHVSLETLAADTRVSKINGTAFDSLWEGAFRVGGIGNCRVCLDPKQPPFIRVETSGGIYLFGTSSEAETLALFEKIQAAAGAK